MEKIGWRVGGGGVERSDQQERKEEDEGKSWQLYAGCALVGPEYCGGSGVTAIHAYSSIGLIYV